MNIHRRTSELLTQIEQELKQTGLWCASAPEPAALGSSAPFCCDTLAFEQWLQFIYLPRLQAMATSDAPLPSNIAVSPMAEEAFKHLGRQAFPLITLIAAVDQLLSGQRSPEQGG